MQVFPSRFDPPAPPSVTLALGCLLAVVLALSGGCAAGPRAHSVFGGAASVERDGPEASPPAGLAEVPDAEPKLEPIREGGPNKPYTVWGQTYVPLTPEAALVERGPASWYGRKFNGMPTASGELYNMYAMTAAHPTLPIPSYARIRNPANGRAVIVRINDRGPFHSNRIVDVSYTAALKLDILRGVAPVELERISSADIRTGAWRREPGAGVEAARAEPGAPTASTPGSLRVPDDVVVEVSTAAPTTPAAAPPIEDAAHAQAFTPPARGWWVQLGAFRRRDGAASLQQRVEAKFESMAPMLAVFADEPWFRLQAGPYLRREDARDAAERLRGVLPMAPVIVERR